MNYTIREATEEDFPAIMSLVKELADYERSPDKITNTVEQMKQEKDLFTCLVAESEEKEIVGMALYFFAYFTWVGKSLYLEDIVVTQAWRQHKIGTALLARLMQAAREANCKRVRWQVLSWNESAINFYKKCNAEISDQWLNCTISEEGIAEFCL